MDKCLNFKRNSTLQKINHLRIQICDKSNYTLFFESYHKANIFKHIIMINLDKNGKVKANHYLE